MFKQSLHQSEYNKYSDFIIMPKYTYENSAYEVSQATDIQKIVNDKCE